VLERAERAATVPAQSQPDKTELRQSRLLYKTYQLEIAGCDQEIEKLVSAFEPRVDPAQKPLPSESPLGNGSSGGLRLSQRLMLKSLHGLIERSNLCRHRFVLGS
jgi:hypothetical protein